MLCPKQCLGGYSIVSAFPEVNWDEHICAQKPLLLFNDWWCMAVWKQLILLHLLRKSVAGEFAFINDVFSTCEILLELLICNKRLHRGYHHVFLPFSGSEYSYRQPSRTVVNNLGALWEILRWGLQLLPEACRLDSFLMSYWEFLPLQWIKIKLSA